MTLPQSQYVVAWRHRTGRARPLNEARECGAYLGIHIAERALSKEFPNIQRMPYGTPGYDYICGKGYKIDVKSACRRESYQAPMMWSYYIRRNSVPDYFLCLAFDNRENLEPLHVWLIPKSEISHLMGFSIFDSKKSLSKWGKYERPKEAVVSCCNKIRTAEESKRPA